MPLLYWTPYACIKPVYHTRCFSAWTESSESNPIIQIKRSHGIFELQSCIRTTSFSNIFERLMYNHLLSFVNKCQLLYEYQFGFRCGHSPDLALTCLVDKISNALENGECVLGLFLDFSKAFDTVNHDILFEKLEYLGIRGIPLMWCRNFLSDREQYVVYNDTSSSSKKITCGVPQGSILGPLLFLLYINDLSRVSDVLFILLFADESNLFLSAKCPERLMEQMIKK